MGKLLYHRKYKLFSKISQKDLSALPPEYIAFLLRRKEELGITYREIGFWCNLTPSGARYHLTKVKRIPTRMILFGLSVSLQIDPQDLLAAAGYMASFRQAKKAVRG